VGWGVRPSRSGSVQRRCWRWVGDGGVGRGGRALPCVLSAHTDLAPYLDPCFTHMHTGDTASQHVLTYSSHPFQPQTPTPSLASNPPPPPHTHNHRRVAVVRAAAAAGRREQRQQHAARAGGLERGLCCVQHLHRVQVRAVCHEWCALPAAVALGGRVSAVWRLCAPTGGGGGLGLRA
jgi:hypothetical protein